MARREEKAAATREAILKAAMRVVGRHGYGKASIARIAEEAGVAHGLIYVYFKNQQDLFDQLLPYVGEVMLRHIADQIAETEHLADRERRGLNANFEFMQKNPAMHRIFNEAAFFAQPVHQAFLRRMASGYTRSLKRSYDTGELKGFGEDELEVLAYMMIGAREFLLERYAVRDGLINDLPEPVKCTYLKAFIRCFGLDENEVENGEPKTADRNPKQRVGTS
ncbi:TetR/AcrR family transcriptional regulator [Rhodoligotrophos ferricapiens]|uniref:TetR/AcrR family transcriptional regulator n=1 Tax=Rhodoligotrophos ferricapiens TaxID=3069264 RepID=UPI00315DFD1B